MDSAAVLVPSAPLLAASDPSGYLQITLTEDGRLAARGSRLLLDWLLRQLAADGWQIDCDQIHWCG